jgi:hypothetical protein
MRWIVERFFAHLMRSPPPGARLRALHQQCRGDGLLVDDHDHGLSPCPAAPVASVNRLRRRGGDLGQAGACDDPHMSYDLAVWDGEQPRDEEAGALFDELYLRYLDSEDVVVEPSPRIQAYVEALVERYPDDVLALGRHRRHG